MMFVLALSSLLPMYVVGDLAWSSFGIVLVLYALTFWSFEGLAQMLSTFSNVIIGLFGFLNLYFAAFLFCGMFVDPEDVIWPIRVFCYFMPLGWTLQSYMYALMHDMPDHSGTFACSPGDELPTGGVCTDQGFYCASASDPNGAVCYGKDGDTILESLSVQFTIFEANGHYARNIGLIVAFGALTRLVYVAAIYVLTKMYGGQAPGAPGDDVAVPMEYEADDAASPRVPHSSSGADIALSDVELKAFDTVGEAAEDGTGVEFAFKNICYSISAAKKDEPDVDVLRDVSGSVREGELMAIVGPSGAGKTILLDTLTFNKGPGAPSGEISLNGKKMTRADFAKDAIYVPREDNLWPTMSPRQHVAFAFKMYRSDLATKAARDAEVDELLSVTGLTSCADTMAGGFLFKGLSGGQRRRLSLAVALVKQPSLIVLDEPTSGLDSAAAAAILTLLARVARASPRRLPGRKTRSRSRRARSPPAARRLWRTSSRGRRVWRWWIPCSTSAAFSSSRRWWRSSAWCTWRPGRTTRSRCLSVSSTCGGSWRSPRAWPSRRSSAPTATRSRCSSPSRSGCTTRSRSSWRCPSRARSSACSPSSGTGPAASCSAASCSAPRTWCGRSASSTTCCRSSGRSTPPATTCTCPRRPTRARSSATSAPTSRSPRAPRLPAPPRASTATAPPPPSGAGARRVSRCSTR